MQQKPLQHSIFPYTDQDFGQQGYILHIRHPYAGETGQGFYLQLEDATRAYHRALHRYHSGENVMSYLDPAYAPVPTGGYLSWS